MPALGALALGAVVALGPGAGHPGPAEAERVAQAAAVTVSVTMGGTPVAGAFVAATGATGQHAAVTGAGGQALLGAVDVGTYTLAVSAPGAAVSSRTLTIPSDASVTEAVTLTSSGSRFTGLGAFGGQVGTIVSDGGKSGVFYANTTASPSLYRTSDHGGNWAPVTVSSDDADDGIDGRSVASIPATSGQAGEIAAVVGAKLYYSRDFGVTWLSLNAPSGIPPNQARLFWSHVGSTSRLFLVDSGTTGIAWTEMPTFTSPSVTPWFMPMASSYKSLSNDRVWIANGSVGPVVAVAPSTGAAVTLFSVSATPDSTDSRVTVVGSGTGTTPTFVRVGGPPTGGAIGATANEPPNTILVYSNDATGAAVMSVYSGGAWSSTTSTQFKDSNDINTAGTFNGGPSSCGAQPGAVGSIAPTGGVGTVAQCWVTRNGTALDTRNVININNNTGVAYDAGYGGASNLVIMSGDGNYGLKKSAANTIPLGTRPDFPSLPPGGAWSDSYMATAGTGPASGGIATNGMGAAVVKDTDFGPTANDIAVVLSFTGGNRVLASGDAGATWQTINAAGGNAVAWWRSSAPGESWIVSARTGAGNLLYSLNVGATGLASGATMTYLSNTALSDFGLAGPAENADVLAIVGLPGTSVAYAAVTNGTDTALAKLTLSGGTVIIGAASQSGRAAAAVPAISVTGQVVALAYCPTAGSASGVTDVLYAAVKATTEGGSDGKLLRVTGATTVPVVTTVSGSGDFHDVRAQCSAGVVFASMYAQSGQSGLVKSTDGTTFLPVTIGGMGPPDSAFRQVETLAVNPASAQEVVVVSRSGDVALSKDGGSTWASQNDTTATAGKSFGAEKPGDVAIPPPSAASAGRVAAGRDAQAAVSSSSALLGSGGGLFAAAVRGASTVPNRLFLPLVLRSD